jgi:hypothetical protein
MTVRSAPLLAVVLALVLPAAASARAVLYGSPGPEQAQLQQWLDESHAPEPTIAVRLYEGNCEEGQPGGEAAEETEEQERQSGHAGPIQTCAAFTAEGRTPTSTNEAVYIPHMSWHPQYPAWWWHLNLLNEFGHIYDAVEKDHGHYREAFSRIYGYNPKWWWPVNAWAAINTEWEKWSMAYAFCGYGMDYAEARTLIADGEYSGFGFNPAPPEYAATCRLIDRQ